MGHGEWAQMDDIQGQAHGLEILHEPHWVQQWLVKQDEDIANHDRVIRHGYPNRWGAQEEVKSKWNLNLMEQWLMEYEDREVVEWMRYGWPTGRLPTMGAPGISNKKHKGATDYPEHLTKYIQVEQKHGAVMGPFHKIPFQGPVGISPLSTRAKKDSDDRRVILDLSFPPGEAVNDGIPKDTYLGFAAKLTFPKTDDFAFRIFHLGKGCGMFKIDLSRYFRQLPLDPGDYSLISYIINGEIYFDKVLPMGMRSAPYIAQRVTNAIAYIHRQLGYFLLNYVDDFVGGEEQRLIEAAYQALTNILQDLGVNTSPNKIVPPTTRLEFLGITFDSDTMTMEISAEKMREIKQELTTWLYKTTARRKEVESLIGKLQFMAKCVRADRIFLNRLIEWIRHMDRRQQYHIPVDAWKDIAWWSRFAQNYNGVSLLWLIKEPSTDLILQTDACPKGYGGICRQEYFRGRFPKHLQSKNIAVLEIWAVMIGVKLWANQLKGKYLWIHVDNEAVATVLNTGKARDKELQNSVREIALIAAEYQFVTKARHIAGIDNRIPDWLSRWDEPQARQQFRQYAKDSSLKYIRTSTNLLNYIYQW